MENKYLLIVRGDWNDGDLVSSQSFIDEESVEKIKKVVPIIERLQCQKVQEFSPHLNYYTIIDDLSESMDNIFINYDNKVKYEDIGHSVKWEDDCKLTQEEVELILWFDEEFMPYGYVQPCHTLEDVQIYETKTILDYNLKTRYYDEI